MSNNRNVKSSDLFSKIFESDQGDIPTANLMREWSKWVFDFVKNVLFLGVVKFFAVRTGNIYVEGAFWVYFGAFLFYYYQSYWAPLRINVFSLVRFKNKNATDVARLVDLLVFKFVVGMAIFLWSYKTLLVISEELATAQVR